MFWENFFEICKTICLHFLTDLILSGVWVGPVHEQVRGRGDGSQEGSGSCRGTRRGMVGCDAFNADLILKHNLT